MAEPLLALLFRLWIPAAPDDLRPALVLMLVFTAFLLWMTATDFEQYCLFDAMMLPFALGALVMLARYPDMLVSHLLAGLAGGVVFLAVGLLSRGHWAGETSNCWPPWACGWGRLVFVAAAGTVLGGAAAWCCSSPGRKAGKALLLRTVFYPYRPGLMLVRGL